MTVRARTASRFRLAMESLESREVPATFTGPSTATVPYILPSNANIDITSILTVGDSVGGYRMVGIPDGLGAYDNGDGTFTVLMNHELGATVGVTRDHGSRGAFVSKWVIDKTTLEVVSGDDLIKSVYLWDSTANGGAGGFVAGMTAFNRLCSADLPDATAFYNATTGLGTTARIFMNGEETSNGRSFAHVVTGPEAGTSWELPWTGKYAWENHVASPFAQDKTIVMGLDDSRREFSSEGATEPSEVYVWVGNKQATGTEIERAGLVSGILHGLRVGLPGAYDANESTVTSGERFELVALSDQTNNPTFQALETESIAKTITQFRRVEDGAFDPNNPNDFYFVTTDVFTGNSRLWLLRFDDITNPEAGGTISIAVNGAAIGAHMFDNIAVDGKGRVILQEDPGNQSYLARMWAYDIATGAIVELAAHDPARFTSGLPGFLTQDEEASGVIDVSHILGDGTYLLTDQIHTSAGDAELVEKGQFLLMKTGVVAGLGFDTKGGNAPALVVLGTNKGDQITITQDGTDYTVTVDGQIVLGDFAAPSATKVFAVGYQGRDVIDASGLTTNAVLSGGNGKDTLIGGHGSDVLDGGNGKDTLIGGDGSDLFYFDADSEPTDFVAGIDVKKKKK